MAEDYTSQYQDQKRKYSRYLLLAGAGLLLTVLVLPTLPSIFSGVLGNDGLLVTMVLAGLLVTMWTTLLVVYVVRAMRCPGCGRFVPQKVHTPICPGCGARLLPSDA